MDHSVGSGPWSVDRNDQLSELTLLTLREYLRRLLHFNKPPLMAPCVVNVCRYLRDFYVGKSGNTWHWLIELHSVDEHLAALTVTDQADHAVKVFGHVVGCVKGRV